MPYSKRMALRSRSAAVAAASSSSAAAAVSRDGNSITFTNDDGGTQPVAGTSTGHTDSTQLTSQLDNMQVDDDNESSDDDMEEYGDMHRLVLQGVMSAGYLDAKGVKKLFHESGKFFKCKIPSGRDIYKYIKKVVGEINKKIKIYDMMIRSATCEITGDKYYVFLVTIEKPIMKMQKYFSKVEVDLFQKILDSLLRKHTNFAISIIECVNMVGELDSRAFTKVNAEDFVDSMISMKYFTKVYKDNDKDKEENDRDYDITLGFRAIREFEPIFRDVYGDIFGNCCLCRTILLNGLQCPKCPVVIHRACLKGYIKRCESCVSPSCKGVWKNEGALRVRTRDESGEPLSSSAHTSSQDGSSQTGEPSQTSGLHASGTGGDDVDMPVLDPVGSPRSTRATQSSKKDNKKTKKTPVRSQPRRSSKRKVFSSSSESESD